MNLHYTHKPNYYFFAHKLVLFLENYIKHHPNHVQETFNLNTIYDLFDYDFASSSTNLEGILNIVDEYVIETNNGNEPLVKAYHISHDNHILTIDFNSNAIAHLAQGKVITYPKAA